MIREHAIITLCNRSLYFEVPHGGAVVPQMLETIIAASHTGYITVTQHYLHPFFRDHYLQSQP